MVDRLTLDVAVFRERGLVVVAEKARDEVAEDGDQPVGRHLLVVEVDERLDGQIPRLVSGHDRVVHDLLTANLGHQPELHSDGFLRQVEKLQLEVRNTINPAYRMTQLSRYL